MISHKLRAFKSRLLALWAQGPTRPAAAAQLRGHNPPPCVRGTMGPARSDLEALTSTELPGTVPGAEDILVLCAPRHPRHQLRLLQRGAGRNERASRRGPGLRNHLPHEQTAKAPESCPAETPPSVLFLPYSTPVLVGLTGGHQVPCGARCSTWDRRAAKLAPPKGDKRPEPNRTGEARWERSHICCPSSEHRPIRKGLQGPRHEKSPPCDPQHCL